MFVIFHIKTTKIYPMSITLTKGNYRDVVISVKNMENYL